MVQTRPGSAASINIPGSSVVVLDGSLIQFADSAITLQHGELSVSTSKSLSTGAGDVAISPTAAVWTGIRRQGYRWPSANRRQEGRGHRQR